MEVEYLRYYARSVASDVPRVGGVYVLNLTNNRYYVGESGNIRTRFLQHLRNFRYKSAKEVLGVHVIRVKAGNAPDKIARWAAECGLHRGLVRNGATVVNSRRYIPGC